MRWEEEHNEIQNVSRKLQCIGLEPLAGVL